MRSQILNLLKQNGNKFLSGEYLADTLKVSRTAIWKHIKALQSACKKPIVIVYPDGIIKEYDSARDAEMEGFNHSLIAACCKGKQKTTRGCRCYYKVDYYGNPT